MLAYLSDLKEYYSSGETLSYAFRIEQLKKFKLVLKQNEMALIQALAEDLNKPEFEAYSGEIALLYKEIDYMIKNLKQWIKPEHVLSSIISFYATSYTVYVPRGVVLIIAPWNYPVQLLFNPLIGSIAAGNCSVLKPSEYNSAVNRIIKKIILEAFPANYVWLCEGDGKTVIEELLANYRFNYVFFTGSTQVGKSIAVTCGQNLIPYTLELGGKSPAIVDNNVDLVLAARRIAWGKFFNAGQICVAPDYVLVHESIKPKFIETLTKILNKFYVNANKDMAKIININRFNKLISYLAQGQIIYGGSYNQEKLQIMPTLIDEPGLNAPIMQEEIFGPILPIISYHNNEQLKKIIARNPDPLALYVFSKNKQFIDDVIKEISFGGGCVNSSLVHITNLKLPFGGVMSSGSGAYHGKSSFTTFSHQKSIVNMSTAVDANLKYPPYSRFKNWIIRKII
ncbi:MAG: hypothetical protein RL017_42 [Pseudomonadota bacterium]|jgi:aldehyde dehydrogenase (NAD+)